MFIDEEEVYVERNRPSGLSLGELFSNVDQAIIDGETKAKAEKREQYFESDTHRLNDIFRNL